MKLQAENGQTITLTDENQIAAFLKGGFTEVKEDDLNELKAMADELGVEYSPNIGIAKLRERIEKQ